MSTATGKPVVQLLGADGNAFNIIGRCLKAGKKAGWDKTRLDAFQKEAMSGDYDHLLSTVMENFEDESAEEEDFDEDYDPEDRFRDEDEDDDRRYVDDD